MAEEKEEVFHAKWLKEIVELSQHMEKAGTKGPFTVDMSLSVAAWVEKKNAYRRVSIYPGDVVNFTGTSVGKKGGLIFSFGFEHLADRPDHVDKPSWIECSWSDLSEFLPDFRDRAEEESEAIEASIALAEKRMNTKFKANPKLHQRVNSAIKNAQLEAGQAEISEVSEALGIWGTC